MKSSSIIAVIFAINILFVSSKGNFLQAIESVDTYYGSMISDLQAPTPTQLVDLLQGFISGLTGKECCKINDPALLSQIGEIFDIIKDAGSVFKLPSAIKKIIPKAITLISSSIDIVSKCPETGAALATELKNLINRLKDKDMITKVMTHLTVNVFKMASMVAEIVSMSKKDYNQTGRKLGEFMRFALSW